MQVKILNEDDTVLADDAKVFFFNYPCTPYFHESMSHAMEQSYRRHHTCIKYKAYIEKELIFSESAKKTIQSKNFTHPT